MANQQIQIIKLVDTIFQNVGIKRCIDKIIILQNYQIYFEICKIIFPQTMIQLLRFSQGSNSNAQKIQGVIDIVGKILQNDLYHISGQSISDGKLSHIRNFLNILELLSQNVHKANRNQQQIESAPENAKSVSDYDREGNYTVIGIDKQFQRQFYDEQGMNHQQDGQRQGQGETKRQYQNKIHYNQQKESQRQQSQQDSQSEGPMNPILNKKNQFSNKKIKQSNKKIDRNEDKINIREVKPKQFRKSIQYPFYQSKVDRIKNAAFQAFIKRSIKRLHIVQQVKSSYVKKINNLIQDMEAKRLTDLKLDHNEWVRNHQIQTIQKENQIDEQNKHRIQFTNQLIFQRKKKINTLRNAKGAINMMTNLFIEQRQIWKGMRRAKQQSQLQNLQQLIEGDPEDQKLLRDALIAGNIQNFARKRKGIRQQ